MSSASTCIKAGEKKLIIFVYTTCESRRVNMWSWQMTNVRKVLIHSQTFFILCFTNSKHIRCYWKCLSKLNSNKWCAKYRLWRGFYPEKTKHKSITNSLSFCFLFSFNSIIFQGKISSKKHKDQTLTNEWIELKSGAFIFVTVKKQFNIQYFSTNQVLIHCLNPLITNIYSFMNIFIFKYLQLSHCTYCQPQPLGLDMDQNQWSLHTFVYVSFMKHP